MKEVVRWHDEPLPLMSDAVPEPVAAVRRCLFLQGLMGPFFERIGSALLRDGYVVRRINFNGGDRLFWRLPGATDYSGTLRAWPDFLRDYIRREQITDVLLFGDCRPHHEVARDVCGELHIPVHVFEEGYIRPDWVTLELGGVNGHSRLPRDPEYYRREATRLPPLPPHRTVASSFRRRAAEGIAYNATDILTRWQFPHWNNYRPWSSFREGRGWLRRLGRRRRETAESARTIEKLSQMGRPYILFPLQLDADAQVRLHSPFSGIEEAIEQIIASFARHAPPEQVLVVKEHPLDNGVKNWRALVGACARKHGVLGRVAYLPYGDIAVLVRAAKGVVTINSTTGTLALAAGVPVLTLGQAVYNIRDITHRGPLDEFWSAPQPPDEATFEAFRRVLVEYCLIPGGYFSEDGLDLLVQGAVARLERHCPITFAASSRRGEESAQWHSMREPVLSLTGRIADAVGAGE